jgi:hypothetical protein
MRIFVRVVALSGAVLSVSCSDVAPNAGPSAERVTLERVREIVPQGNELSSLFAIDLLSNGDVVAIDAVSRQLFRISDGGTTTALTRLGDGPGEVRGLVGVDVGPADQIAVLDATQRRVIVLADDGAVRMSVSLPPGNPTGVYWGDEPDVVRLRSLSAIGAAVSHLYAVDLNTGNVRETGSTPLLTPGNDSAGLCGFCPTAATSSKGVIGVRGDTMYVLTAYDSTGKSAGVWSVPDFPIPARSKRQRDSIDAQVEKFVATAPRFAGFDAAAERQLRQMMRPKGALADYVTRFRQFSFGEAADGSLWVQPAVPEGDSAALHRLTSHGAAPELHRLPPGRRLLRVAEDLLLFSVEREDRDVVEVYRIRGG